VIRTLGLIAVLSLTGSLAAAEVRELANLADVKRAIKASHAPFRIVNLWATWCGPCVAEMPDLQKLSERFPRVAFIGVSLDDAIPGSRAEMKAKVGQFLHDRHVHYTNFYFTGRQTELTDGLNFEGELPVTFVYDSDGKEIDRVVGRLDYDSFAKKIASLEKRQKR
jgi:thiol-disulfide isomerase/thioredoxin